jgi:uncharacterized ferredoxin-like protein
MTADLRDKIAAVLYRFTEEADHGWPSWDELIANHGEDYDAVVAYRGMADWVMPVVQREIAAWESTSEADTATAAAMASRALAAEDKRDGARAELGRLRREMAAYRASVHVAARNRDDYGTAVALRVANDKLEKVAALAERMAAKDPAQGLRGVETWADQFREVLEGGQDVTAVELGCTCNGMAACEQCQERDARDDEVLVEGSWFKRDDLPRILGNHMRSLAEAEQSLKEMAQLGEHQQRVALEKDLRAQIARDIQADNPFHITRDYNPVDRAYDRCAQIARGDA